MVGLWRKFSSEHKDWIECFCLETIGLLVAPWKFDVLKLAYKSSKLRFQELRHRSCILKILAKLFKIVISNPFQSSPASVILAGQHFAIALKEVLCNCTNE